LPQVLLPLGAGLDDYEQVVVEQEQLTVTVNTLFESVAKLEAIRKG
jgi:hypothetical protein